MNQDRTHLTYENVINIAKTHQEKYKFFGIHCAIERHHIIPKGTKTIVKGFLESPTARAFLAKQNFSSHVIPKEIKGSDNKMHALMNIDIGSIPISKADDLTVLLIPHKHDFVHGVRGLVSAENADIKPFESRIFVASHYPWVGPLDMKDVNRQKAIHYLLHL